MDSVISDHSADWSPNGLNVLNLRHVTLWESPLDLARSRPDCLFLRVLTCVEILSSLDVKSGHLVAKRGQNNPLLIMIERVAGPPLKIDKKFVSNGSQATLVLRHFSGKHVFAYKSWI